MDWGTVALGMVAFLVIPFGVGFLEGKLMTSGILKRPERARKGAFRYLKKSIITIILLLSILALVGGQVSDWVWLIYIPEILVFMAFTGTYLAIYRRSKAPHGVVL